MDDGDGYYHLGRDDERHHCRSIIQQWTSADHIRLHAGELAAQEMRTVKAVVNAILAELPEH